MPLKVPPAQNYPFPLAAVPATWANQLIGMPFMVPVEIDWATMGGANHCVNINMQNNQVQNFNRIVALSVDNSGSAADVQFLFPDTAETVTIPAYSPKTIVPVFTNQTQFFVLAPSAMPSDITRFSFHNSMPPPIAVPITELQDSATNDNVDMTVVADTQLVPLGIDGRLEAIDISVLAANSSAKHAIFQLKDGTGKVLWGARVVSSGLADTFIPVTDLSGLRVPFENGIVCHVVSTTLVAGSTAMFNLYYKPTV